MTMHETGKQHFSEIFDCNKLKTLLDEKDQMSFTDRFRNWVAAYTREAQERIWTDIEYYQAEG